MLTTGLLTFFVGEEWSEGGQPLLAALQQILCRERVGQFLQARRIAALQEGVAALLKIDALFLHPNRQPVVLVEANPRGEREVGTHADEHPAPVWVIQVEVKLVHPTLFVLQMGAIERARALSLS